MKSRSKKLLLLVSGLVLGGASLAGIGCGPCDRCHCPRWSVINTLRMINQNDSLKIKYVPDQDSSKPATITVLRTALTARDRDVFTPKVVKNITFHGQLVAGKTATITATYNNQEVGIFVQEGSKPPAPTPVIDALHKIDQNDPLKIKYVANQDSSNPKTTAVLRAALQKQSKVFTSGVVAKITFKGQLTAGKTATITATYNSQKVVISVQEAQSVVIDALHKITQTNPLPIKYVTDQDSSKPTTTAVLRAALQKQSKVFTSGVVAKITFKGQLTAGKTATITATYNGQGVDIFVQEGSKPTPVIDALHKITQTNPLPIKYVTDQDSSKPTTTAVLRDALQKQSKVFTSGVVAKITFKGQLTAGKTATITATYNSQKVVISVQEAQSVVIDALHKITQTNPLPIKYVTDQDSSKPTTTAVLRAALQKQSKVFTSGVVAKITFKGQLTAGKTATITATYNSQGVDIFVQEGSKPTPVIDALHKITQTNPLPIKYVTDQDSSKPTTTAVLRDALQKQSKVFTSGVVAKITFKGQLTAGKTATITATYNSQKVVISVQEAQSVVIDALHKITQTNPLPIKYVTDQDSSKPTTTAVLRAALQKQSKVFTSGVVAKITFKGQLTAGKTATITATYNGQGVDIFVQEGSKPTPVIDALHKITQINPLKIKYVTDQDSSKPTTTAVLRDALQKQSKVFTSGVVAKITFKGQLTAGKTATITATYNSQGVDIFVQEGSKPTPVIDALHKITQINPLKIKYVTDQDSSKPTTTAVLRDALQKQSKVFTSGVVAKITFKGQLTAGKTATITATYNSQGVDIFVQEGSKPTPVIDALHKITQTNPLKIKYVTDQDSSKPTTTAVLRDALQKQSKVFTSGVVAKITFKGQLTAGKTATITATYNSQGVDIFVQEKAHSDLPLPSDVFKVLSRYTSQHPLFGVNHYSAFTAQWMRNLMLRKIQSKYITTKVVNKITFLNLKGIATGTPYLLKIKYQGQRGSFWVLLYVLSSSQVHGI